MLKKVSIFLGLVLVAMMLAVGGLYAKGGSAEVLLWVVKIFLRQEHAPNREVKWAVPTAPTAIAGNPQAGSERKPPNIILIVADDLGYNDITLNGGGLAGGTVPTPNINSLAQEGANFQTSYSERHMCTLPSGHHDRPLSHSFWL